MNKTETKVKSKRIYYYHIDDLGILYKYITQKNKKLRSADPASVRIKNDEGYGLSDFCLDRSISIYPRTFEALKKHLVEDHEEWIEYHNDKFISFEFESGRKEKLEHKNFIKKEREYIENLKKTKNYPEIDKVFSEWTFTKEFVECLKEDYGSNCFDFRNQDKAKESKVEIND
jgi:lipoate-protein ligase A